MLEPVLHPYANVITHFYVLKFSNFFSIFSNAPQIWGFKIEELVSI